MDADHHLTDQAKLIAILQMAYSGELAAGYAWSSRVSIWPAPPPKEAIRQSFELETH